MRAARFAVGLGLGLVLAASAFAIDAGQPAPDIELPATTAPVAKVSGLKGKLVYLDFWASWCGPCRQSFPWMNEMQRKYGAQGLQVVAVNLDARRADADAFLAQVPAQFVLAFDAAGQSARRYGVKGMPSSVLIGRDGRVLFVHQGFREDERRELEARLSAALATP